MKKIELGEETRKFAHPDDPDVRVPVAIPDRLHLAQIAEKLADAKGSVAAVETSEQVLAELLRGAVEGVEAASEGKPHIPTPEEWAHALAGRAFEFRREGLVLAWNHDGVLKDPDTSIPLKDGQHRVLTDPDTGRIGVYLVDEETGKPARRMRTTNFSEYILERVLRNTPETESGKDSPTLSIEQ
jgi:hypothetical protein